MNKLSNEIKIALVALFGILVLYFGMTFLKGMFIFSHESSYFARFDRVDGLTPSSPVLANGFKVGIVKKINYDFKGNNGIVAELEIEDELQIPQGTKAVIDTQTGRYHRGGLRRGGAGFGQGGHAYHTATHT